MLRGTRIGGDMHRRLRLGTRFSVSLLVVATLALAMVATAGGASASATNPLKTGRAIALFANTPVTGILVVSDTGDVSTTSSTTVSKSVLALPGPNPTGSVLTAVVTTTRTESTAQAYVASLGLLVGTLGINATAVKAQSVTDCAINTSATPPNATVSSGSTTIAFLKVGGSSIVNAKPAPNTKLINTSLLKVVLNEQIRFSDATGGGLLVNAVHITSSALGIDVIISSARSDIHNCGPIASGG